MQKSSYVMKYVFIALAGMAFVIGFLAKDGKLGKRQAPTSDAPLIKLDQYIKPIDPALIGYEEIDQLEIELKAPHALAVNDKNLCVAGNDEIHIFKNFDRHFTRVFLEKSATSLAIAPDGHIYVGVRDHIHHLDQQGKLIREWEKINNYAHLTSLAVTESEVFAADAGSKIIWRYSCDGELLGRIGERDVKQGKLGFVIPGPFFDLAIDRENMLWAVNPGRLALENYTKEGKLQSSWGKISIDVDGFCGCCNPTHMAILPDGAFLTAEKGIPRVKIYEPTGELRTVVAGPKQFAGPLVIADIAVDAKGRILVLDSAAKAVRIFAKKREK